jgi:hypothetical protein
MEIVNRNIVEAFITRDGSEIREILASRNSPLRNQSAAEARLSWGKPQYNTTTSSQRRFTIF